MNIKDRVVETLTPPLHTNASTSINTRRTAILVIGDILVFLIFAAIGAVAIVRRGTSLALPLPRSPLPSLGFWSHPSLVHSSAMSCVPLAKCRSQRC